ncbi:hypothetical protein SBA6_730011 [Candidatus Sulfopaludibacter sp. SbA6]|nr:hypothetical protein SBA6_730011 [Candidatus Sulfopaludibacter sp. SbA6]
MAVETEPVLFLVLLHEIGWGEVAGSIDQQSLVARAPGLQFRWIAFGPYLAASFDFFDVADILLALSLFDPLGVFLAVLGGACSRSFAVCGPPVLGALLDEMGVSLVLALPEGSGLLGIVPSPSGRVGNSLLDVGCLPCAVRGEHFVQVGRSVPMFSGEHLLVVLLSVLTMLRKGAFVVRKVPIALAFDRTLLAGFTEAIAVLGLLVPEFRSARKFLVADVARSLAQSKCQRKTPARRSFSKSTTHAVPSSPAR